MFFNFLFYYYLFTLAIVFLKPLWFIGDMYDTLVNFHPYGWWWLFFGSKYFNCIVFKLNFTCSLRKCSELYSPCIYDIAIFDSATAYWISGCHSRSNFKTSCKPVLLKSCLDLLNFRRFTQIWKATKLE